MTTVEKRRSGRKSGGRRKHSDGGYSDTSSCGSFLDENDREVSNLTDRAFRSLCIGDEAVYNDSDLGLSSPSTQRDRQLAFSQDREREELKRTAHENFSLRVQQYEQDWIHGGMYGAEVHRDPQWEAYGERTQGRVSATFQHSFVETSQQEKSLREEQLSILSNGASEVNSQQVRSRSRVSSLIRVFNSEGHRDVAATDDRLRELNDETSWDKSALMSIQRELSEFSTPYQHNFNSGHFPTAGPFSPPDTNFYSSEVAAVAHMSHNSAAAFMRSSHSKHSVSAQVNCNSNFFIHSEFSPFKVWRDRNRFPFQHGQVSGFMPRSEFPKWYETPMYKELSLCDQPQAPYRGGRQSHLAPVVHPAPLRSTSTSTVMQKASSVEKRCESELAGHYPHRKRTQSLGANRLPTQRPSTASPTSEMSRCVRDTISSVKALQQKIKMMTEQNVATGVIPNQQGHYYTNDNSFPFGNNAGMMAPTVVSSSTTPFNMSQMLTPSANAHHGDVLSDFQHYELSAPPVEHAPVRAESRGATPDVRMSSYRSRATSLLFNLKDNRKRVKSTYSPPKFKGPEIQEKNKRPSTMEPRETVIDIPDFVDPYTQFPPVDEANRLNAYQYAHQYQSSMLNSLPAPTHAAQYPEYMYDDQTAQLQGQMVHHSGFTGFIPENYTSNQLTNGQNLHQDLASFAPYKQGGINNVTSLGGDAYRLKPAYTAAEMMHFNAESTQGREYLLNQTSAEQLSREAFGRVLTQVDRYEHLGNNQQEYNDAFSQDRRQPTFSQNTEQLSLKASLSTFKEEPAAFVRKTRQENQPDINKEVEKAQLREGFSAQMSSSNISNGLQQYAMNTETMENPAYYGQQQNLAVQENIGFQRYPGHHEENPMKYTPKMQNNNRYMDHEYSSYCAYYPTEDKLETMQKAGHRKPNAPNLKGHETQILQLAEAEIAIQPEIHPTLFSNPDSAFVPAMTNQKKDGQCIDVKAEQLIVQHIQAEPVQAALAETQKRVQVELPKVELAGSILAEQTGCETIRTEQAKTKQTQQELLKQDKAETIKEEKKEDQKQEFTEKQNIVQKKANEPCLSVTDSVNHTSRKQSDQVTVERTETEKLAEKRTKVKPTNNELDLQAKIIQAKPETVTHRNVNSEPVEKEELRKVQVGAKERTEAEQIRTETVNVKQVGTESLKAEQINGQIEKQPTKAEPAKTMVAEQKVGTDRNKTQDVGQAKYQRDSVQVDAVKVKQPATLITSAMETKVGEKKAGEMKLERSKVEGYKAELTRGENMEKRSAKLTAKLTSTQPAKSEPDRVEQVKTELAKAKAELAKIKEKMKGEQKEKVRNTVVTEDATANTNGNPKLNLSKEDHNKVEHEARIHQQKEVSAVRNISRQPDRGAEEYDRLREKYGFVDAVSTDKTKASATENVAFLDNNRTQTSPPNKVESVSKEKSEDKHGPTRTFTTAATENKKEVDSFKSNEATESQYVYSESSKEFKLSCANDPPTEGNKSNSAIDNVKDDHVEDNVDKLRECNPVKDSGVSLQKDSDSTKAPPPGRKTKLSEHTVGPLKELQSKTLPKARAQTKQEILTSKILAHAEKEISAIKEKGFAMRDGSKSSKHLQGGQTVNIRQKPPSQDSYRKHEDTMSSSVASKDQMGVSGLQVEPEPNVSPPSSVTTPVKPSADNTQPTDLLLKPVSQKTMEINSCVPEPSLKPKQTDCDAVNATSSSVQIKKQENPPEQGSSLQAEDQPPKVEQEKTQIKEEALPKKRKELDENPDLKTNPLNRKEDEPSEMTKAANEKVQSKGAPSEDLATPPTLVSGQKESPVSDDTLQIMGIMVTVQDRKQSLDLSQMNYTTQNSMTTTEKECDSSSGQDKRQDPSSKEGTIGKVKVGHKNCSDDQEDQTKAEPENAQRASTSGKRENNITGDTKETNRQHGSSPLNETLKRETKPEKLAENVETVSVHMKDKVLAETQLPLYKQDTTTRQIEDPADKKVTKADEGEPKKKNVPVIQAPHTNSNLVPKDIESKLKDDNALTQINLGVQPSATEDKTKVTNQLKNSHQDNKSASLLEKKRRDSAPPRAFDKATENSLTGIENKDVSPKQQFNESHEVTNQESDEVHIGTIAIRVVPPSSTNDNVRLPVKHQSITSPSGVALSNEHEAVSSSSKENSNIMTNEDPPQCLSEASSEKKIKDSLEDELEVKPEFVSVSKVSDLLKKNTQPSSRNEACSDTRRDIGKSERVKKGDESTAPPVEEDYFQVRGVTETSNEPHISATVGDTPKKRELPESRPNIPTLCGETIKDGKSDVFVFKVDQQLSKTVDSTSGNLSNESAKGMNCETEKKLASKLTDGSMGSWSDNKKMETGQTNHIRKDHTEYDRSTSVTDKQSSRSSHPKRENRVKEKPEIKPKPKERSSAIPEISALADYARLKVIVSEEKDVNPVQEFPHNKKQGFFPLIHTRHSRRPVFTLDPHETSVKEKTLPNRTETTAKVNKEPKALVFPITDKEHQRTGMFKLGDKERQEKPLSEGKSDTVVKHEQHRDNNDLPNAQTELAATDRTQRDNHVKLNGNQQQNPSVQITADLASRSQNTSDRSTNLDKTPPSRLITGHGTEQAKNPGSEKEHEDDKLQSKKAATQHEESRAKQQGKMKQPEEQQASKKKEEKEHDDMKIKHMLEESRASQAEEERRAIQREEERRAKEREAIAMKIKERREKQREAERSAEKERQENLREKQKAPQKEEAIKSRHIKEELGIKEVEEKMRTKTDEDNLSKRRMEEEKKKDNERRRVSQREEEKAAREEQLKRAAHIELQRQAVKEQRKQAAQEELQRRAAQEEQQRRAHQEEQQRKAAQVEQQRRAAQEEQQRRAAQEEQQRRVAEEEQQKRAAQEEQQRRAAQEKQKRRAEQEEQQRRVAEEEQQKRAAQEEQQRRAAKEQQRRAAEEEQQRRAAEEEQQRKAAKEQQQRAAEEEQQRRAAEEEQQRKAAKEQQRRAAEEEQQRRVAQEEKQRRVAQEEQRRAVQKEQERRAAHEEQQQRAAQEQQQRRAAYEQQRKAAQEEQQRRAVQEEQRRRAAWEEQQRIANQKEQLKAAEEEQQKNAAQDEQQRRLTREEQKRAAEEVQQRAAREHQRKSAQEQQRRVRQIVSNEEKSTKEEEEKAAHILEEQINREIMENKTEQQTEVEIHGRQKQEDWMRIQKVEEDEEKKILKEREIQASEQRSRVFERSHTDLGADEGIADEQMLLQRNEEFQDRRKREEKLAAQREKIKATQVEKQRRATQTDGLQYYAITSTEPDRKSKERQLYSPLPSQQRQTPSIFESNDRPYRPHAPASPASSLPRSTTSSPALGYKPSMFKVKDNTFRGSSLTKSVKPRFYKNFGEDYWGGEEQEIMRRSAGTPVYPDPGSNRLSAINESSTNRSVSSLDGYSAPASYHRPYSRRSVAMDDDDSRSVFSTTSEGVESFATSAADLADIRGLYDYDRPESACSFSSDVSRSLGKPPTVPPKSEKALRKAQRLTTRRIKKELSKLAENNPTELQKEDNIIPPASSTEVRSSSRHAVASPHFSQPVSLAHAQTVGSSLPSSHAEHQPSHRSFHASPHATGPISLPNSSAHATAALTQPAAPKSVSHSPSSNTLHHVNHPAPVTQYQVESSYPQSYPLTQRKVLQDLGSGQYFVVDVPVEVKTKTFIDPETGKYVQLNVRESGQSIARHPPQQTHPQPQLQPQRQVKPQQQPISRASPAGKPAAHYQGYHGYPNNYQPAAIHSVHSNSSTAPLTGEQERQPVRENRSYGYPAPETGENTEGRRYSPEKTPYMDTVNDMDKTQNRFYGTHDSYESFPECDTNSQLAGRSVCENDNSAPSQNLPREIIPMSELEDFMEISDW